jgi:hypothetical protein
MSKAFKMKALLFLDEFSRDKCIRSARESLLFLDWCIRTAIYGAYLNVIYLRVNTLLLYSLYLVRMNN